MVVWRAHEIECLINVRRATNQVNTLTLFAFFNNDFLTNE